MHVHFSNDVVCNHNSMKIFEKLATQNVFVLSNIVICSRAWFSTTLIVINFSFVKFSRHRVVFNFDFSKILHNITQIISNLIFGFFRNISCSDSNFCSNSTSFFFLVGGDYIL
eukprot:NODE_11_length_54881_cov_1.430718.p41 type:complete len:113 gc:universal NODE_11_length_54881_cov_1.430718:13368-13030(-)